MDPVSTADWYWCPLCGGDLLFCPSTVCFEQHYNCLDFYLRIANPEDAQRQLKKRQEDITYEIEWEARRKRLAEIEEANHKKRRR